MTNEVSMMSITNDIRLVNLIIEHEGKISYAYPDSEGYLTIGVGRLIDKRLGGKLSDDEINYLLQNDLQRCRQELEQYKWFTQLDEVRQGVLIELCFNLGLPRLLKFQRMINALIFGNYKAASAEMLASDWSKQVSKERVQNMFSRLISGEY